jgi:hypothetical protein
MRLVPRRVLKKSSPPVSPSVICSASGREPSPRPSPPTERERKAKEGSNVEERSHLFCRVRNAELRDCPRKFFFRHSATFASASMLCVVLVLGGVLPASAQNSDQPDLRMLLNLDLFRPPLPSGERAGGAMNSADSTLDQLRTLDALGYLDNRNSYAGAARTDSPSLNPQPPASELYREPPE